ncbi:cytochrome P450 [Achlya hypogyna]|uniref:Cytochrome P450 n=1 Tax=Achlya hypogyna TaxID=1202772 RepID=A0A0A7CPH4_ACHHY|nr:secreted protein [Achlya hypogyna]OQR96297.1 cytochrome P450 [Achlya hypogyna]
MLSTLPLLALVSTVAASACFQPPVGWTMIPGMYHKVTYDGTTLCALDLSYQLRCAKSTTAPIPWAQIPGSYADIGLARGVLYARKLDAAGTMVVTTSTKAVKWKTVNLNYAAEKQTSFSFDGATLCQSTSTKSLWCTNTTNSVPPYTWNGMDGNVTQTAVGGAWLYGLDAKGTLYQGTTTLLANGCGNWNTVANQHLTQLSYDGKQICGVDDSGRALCTSGTLASPAPPSQCCFKDGDVISLRADSGSYLTRCSGCLPSAAYPNSATVSSTSSSKAVAQWTVKNVGGGKITLKADSGLYLARCNGCVSSATFVDEAFVHSTDPTKAHSQWTCVDAGNGKIGLQADTGKFLSRCNGCVKGSTTPNVAMVQAANMSDATAVWTVFQGGQGLTNRCPVVPLQFQWQSFSGSWTSITSNQGRAFAIDTSSRLFMRQVAATATA